MLNPPEWTAVHRQRKVIATGAEDSGRPADHHEAMEPDPPPEVDAEYRLVHGPWPRWAMQVGLAKLALRTAGIAAVLCLLAVALVFWLAR